MNRVIWLLVAMALLVAFVAHYTGKNPADVTPRDVAKAMPSVELKDGSITIKR